MKSSYKKEDVILLLKDISGQVAPQSTLEREKLIQAGKHYCEMLPIEYEPSPAYLQAYQDALVHYAAPTARAVAVLADKIMQAKGGTVVLVSLARAGIPIGILLKRYLQWKYQVDVPHYAISIIRGRGIDHNAMAYLLAHHPAQDILFVDGWVGKGAILHQLEEALVDYPDVSCDLAVLADPANVTALCGTHADILIPSSCLNATVTGLVSRTFLRDDIIGAQDFHGAVYYEALSPVDLSHDFLSAIAAHFETDAVEQPATLTHSGLSEVQAIATKYQLSDINLIKPGIGETTRVLLRRVPWAILVRPDCLDDPALTHILQLAKERAVPILSYPLHNYKVCGIIKKLSDI